MATVEKLLVQIFERKKSIVDQFKHQTLLFDQHLASKCLLDGIAPPPWLWSPSFSSLSSDLSELNKEELISGLLGPCLPSAIPYSGSYSALYNKPVITTNRGDLPDSFYEEVHTSNKGFDAGDQLPVFPQFPVNDAGGASDCVQKPETSDAAAFPKDQRDASVSDVSPEPAPSLAHLQRSKSRQRALELRNSAKTVKSHLRDENNAGVFHLHDEKNTGVSASRITCSEIAPLQHDHVDELELIKYVDINNKSAEVEEAKVGEFHSEEKEVSKEKLISGPLFPASQPATSYSSSDRVPYYKPTIISDNELPDGQFTEVHASGKGFEAADGLSDLHQFPVNDAGSKSNDVLELHSGATSPEVQRKARISDIDPGPIQSLARVHRSKSRQRALELRNSAKTAKNFCVDNNICVYPSVVTGSGIASVQSDQVHESEMVKTIDFYNGSHELKEAKLYDLHGKEKDCNIYYGRIARSRGSGLEHSSIRESSNVSKPTYIGKSSREENNFCSPDLSRQQTEEKSTGAEKAHGLLSDTAYASPSLRVDGILRSNVNQSPVDKMDHVEQHMTGESKSRVGISSPQLEHGHKLELFKPVDIYHESSVVEEEKVVDFEGKEKGNNIYSGRVSRSQNSGQQPSSMRESSHVSKSTYIGKYSGDENNVDWGENIGGLLTDAVSASPSLREDDMMQLNVNQSPVDKMDYVEQHMTGECRSSFVGISSQQLEHVHKLELVKLVDICNERSVVDEAKVGDAQGKEKSSNIYSGRITRSRSSSQQTSSTRDSLNVSNSSCTGRSSCDDKNAGSSKSKQQSRKKSILSEESSSSGPGGSWLQSKRRKVKGQLNDSLPASPSLREGVEQSNDSKSLVCEMDQNGGCHMIGGSQSSFNLHVDKGELCLEERDKSAYTPFTFVQEDSEVPLILSLADQATADSKGCSDVEAGAADPISAILDSSKWCNMGENAVLLHLDDKLETGNKEHVTCSERGTQETKSHLGENSEYPYCSVGSPQRQSKELIGAAQAMPEFEGFMMQTDNEHPCLGENISFGKLNLPKHTIERASVLEQLCKSACIQTPLSHLSTTYKLHRATNLYNSVPNGLLECMDLRSDLSVNDDTGNELKNLCFNEEVYQAFQGRSHSDCLPFSSAQSAWDIRKPFISPVGKIWDRITSNSGSSEKRGSLNSELPCISEENENSEEVADVFQEGMSSEVMPSKIKREPLTDITENPNLPASVSEAAKFVARNSTESVKTEYSFSGTCNRIKQKLGHHNSSKKRLTSKAKVSQSISLGENGINMVRESVRTRFSKQKLSGKPSSRKGGPGLAERESKRNNIVSNVTSFIPLVQQKQPAAIITGKRDVKVKALEAAEAAKRLAEERENERKMKKEALKLERARLEQENLKQLELQKKKKEEDRKKKEVEIAARKRQREEEERKEKERKRKRLVPASKLQQENEEKLRAKKENEVKGRTMDERVNEMKVSKDETGKDNSKGKEMGDENHGKMLKTEPKKTVASASHNEKASIVLEVCEASTDSPENSMAMSNLDKATESDILCTSKNQEDSYDISPYKVSDDEDEDEEEDHKRNRKFMPSWARKNYLAVVVSSQHRLKPETIFPPESFCTITEVLLPRKHQLK